MLRPCVREHLPCAWINEFEDHISRAQTVGGWVAGIFRKDRVLEEGIEVSPDQVRETDIERPVCRVGELDSQSLIGHPRQVIYQRACLHGGRPRSQSQTGEVCGY